MVRGWEGGNTNFVLYLLRGSKLKFNEYNVKGSVAEDFSPISKILLHNGRRVPSNSINNVSNFVGQGREGGGPWLDLT